MTTPRVEGAERLGSDGGRSWRRSGGGPAARADCELLPVARCRSPANASAYIPAFSSSGWVTSAIEKQGYTCSNMDRPWANPDLLAPLQRVRWANAAIDSAQVILQTAIPVQSARALSMPSLPSSSMKSLRNAEVSQNRITVSNHDLRSRSRSSAGHHHSA